MIAPRHILMTTDAVGGVWTFATTLARQLARSGTQVTLVCLGPPPQDEQLRTSPASGEGVELIVTDLALEWLDPEGCDVSRARSELLRIAERQRPDIVHLNSFREGAIPWPCPAIAVGHSCVLSWWQAVHGGRPSEARWRAYSDAVAAGLDAVDAWAAPTAAFRSTLEEIYRPAATGWVIPNGIEPRSGPALSKRPIILSSGRIWDAGKNLSALAQAAPHIPWPVCIAGAGAPLDCDSSTRNVHWLGELSHAALQDRMAEAAIYAAPAVYEPFGLGILEAASAGCALVLSDIASLRELWDGAALFVRPSDPDHLAWTLRDICRNDEMRMQLQDKTALRARCYALARTAEGYAALYQHAIEAPARRAGSLERVMEVPA